MRGMPEHKPALVQQSVLESINRRGMKGATTEEIKIDLIAGGLKIHGNTVTAALRRLIQVQQVVTTADGRYVLASAVPQATAAQAVKKAETEAEARAARKAVWQSFTTAERSVRANMAVRLCDDQRFAVNHAKTPLHFSAFYGNTGVLGYVISFQMDDSSIAVVVHLNRFQRIRAVAYTVTTTKEGHGGPFYFRGHKQSSLKAKNDYRTLLREHLGESAVK